MQRQPENPYSPPLASPVLASSQTDPPVRASSEPAAKEPGLFRDLSFWGLTGAQFLGAFNDNLYKQLLLLLFVVAPAPDGGTRDIQWLALFAFAFPFLLFSGFAGYLSDKYSKRTLIVVCKAAEIAIMGVAAVVFYIKGAAPLTSPLIAAMTVLIFLMGTHSAFFGPGKYGILPQMLRPRDLPAANGLVLMSTFLGIILGMALGGVFVHQFGDRLWIGGCTCVGIAMLGTLASLVIRWVPPTTPNIRFEWEMLGIPRDIRQVFRRDPSLLYAVIASTVFWYSAALVQPSVNALGVKQLGVSETETSLLAASISIGIAVGSVLAGWLSAGKVSARVLTAGSTGMVLMLLFLAAPGGAKGQWLGYGGSLAVLIFLGMFTGMFAVPLQVFVQARSPEDERGRMIATQSLLQWVGILFSSGVYFALSRSIESLHWPPCTIFVVPALCMLPVAVFYRTPSGDLASKQAGG